MRDLECSIDMRQMPGCQVEEIAVKRTGDNRFWCEGVQGARRLELGPVFLGFDGTLTAHWHPAWPALIGKENLAAFVNALEGFLRQRQVIA